MKCGTLSCEDEATTTIMWPDDYLQFVEESVCRSCADEYLSRPSLKAWEVSA